MGEGVQSRGNMYCLTPSCAVYMCKRNYDCYNVTTWPALVFAGKYTQNPEVDLSAIIYRAIS